MLWSLAMTKPLAFASWSGGKDSALALWKARELFDMRFLLSMMDESGDKSRSHAVPPALLRAQAEALNCEFIAPSASWQDYETQFVAAARELRERGCTHAIFGDIDLQAHRDWEEKVCAAAGVEAVLPLWHVNRRQAVEEFLTAGFRAVVVCVNEKWLDASFCGREFDHQFVADLPPDVDACGENGEFHTFVHDGPLFRQPVPHEVVKTYSYTLPESMGAARFWYAQLGAVT